MGVVFLIGTRELEIHSVLSIFSNGNDSIIAKIGVRIRLQSFKGIGSIGESVFPDNVIDSVASLIPIA